MTIHSANHELLEHSIVSHKFLKYFKDIYFFNSVQLYSLSRHLHPVCRCNKFPFHPTSLILKPPIQSIRVNAISPQPILPPKTKESEVLIRVSAISPQPFPLPQAGESEVLMRGGSGGKTESTLSGLYWSTTLMCIGSD